MDSFEVTFDPYGKVRRSHYTGSLKTRPHTAMKWDDREFIAWDGEGTTPEPNHVPGSELERKWAKEFLERHGESELLKQFRPGEIPFTLTEAIPQPYVLLSNSKGERITNKKGLHTIDCFEFILTTKRQYPNSTFVGFGFNYDVAQMLKDLSWKRLERIYKTNQARYGPYNITWRPRRWLTISDRRVKRRSATIYDTIGFFQSTFLTAAEKYLGKDHPYLQRIAEGKEARSSFTWEELDEFIIPYNDAELEMLVDIMNILRQDLHDIDLNLTQWYGPGAVANQVLKKFNIKEHKSQEIPEEVGDAAQYAYAGGRFEQFYLGRHEGHVYEYDIRSAYPAGAIRVPSLRKGSWELTYTFEPESFGVWSVDYSAPSSSSWPDKPQPLFCRARNGSISFPRQVSGWYWTPEANLVPDFVQFGYVWKSSELHRPFEFIEALYEQRREYKRRGMSSERAIKLALNSIYGKLAQTIGGTADKKPQWHQLEWAGYITSYTRARIYEAILLNPRAIIAAETDAVFSTEPLPLELGKGLGQWEETHFDSILYLQSGFYYAENDRSSKEQSGAAESSTTSGQAEDITCKYRGMDRDRETKQPVGLPYRAVLDHLRNHRKPHNWKTAPLHSSTTRFINIGLALQTRSVFRSWETSDKKINLDQGSGKSKRFHLNCERCQEGFNLADCLHPLAIGGYSGQSEPHPLPWQIGTYDPELEYYLDMISVDKWQ